MVRNIIFTEEPAWLDIGVLKIIDVEVMIDSEGFTRRGGTA